MLLIYIVFLVGIFKVLIILSKVVLFEFECLISVIILFWLIFKLIFLIILVLLKDLWIWDNLIMSDIFF